jgi:hypothetical protein
VCILGAFEIGMRDTAWIEGGADQGVV